MWSTCRQVYRPTFTLDHIWLWSSSAFNLCLLTFSSQTKILNQDLVLLIKLWKKSYCPCIVMQLFLGWLLGFLVSGQTRSTQISEWQLNISSAGITLLIVCGIDLWTNKTLLNLVSAVQCTFRSFPLFQIHTDLSTRPWDKGRTGALFTCKIPFLLIKLPNASLANPKPALKLASQAATDEWLKFFQPALW